MTTPQRIAAVFLSLALPAGCAAPSLEEWPGAAVLWNHPAWRRAADSVVSITVTVPALRGYREGSGFFVGPNLLATDFHVVAEVDRLLTIRLADGTVLPWARVRLISRPYDLALLETPPVEVVPLSLAQGVGEGERVAALAGRWVRTACGLRAAEATVVGFGLHRPPGRPETVGLVLLTPSSVCRGFSGGPVLNEGGEVVGVVRGAWVGQSIPPGLVLPAVEAVAAATAIRHLRQALGEFDGGGHR